MPDLSPAQPPTPPIGGKPRAVTVERVDGALVLRFPWRRIEHAALLALATAGGAAVVGTVGSGAAAELKLLAAAGAVPAAVAAYAALTGLCNQTEIGVGAGRIWARHGPFPWAKGVAISARDVVQVYTKAIQLGRRAGPITARGCS